MKKHLLLPLALPVMLAACMQEPETPVDPAPDACGASGYTALIGQPRAALDSLTLPDGTRIIGPNDAVTMDYRVDRLNFDIDAAGNVARVHCV